MYQHIRNVSGARIAVVEIPNVDNLTPCSFTYWRLEIRMSNVQSPIRNVLHIADYYRYCKHSYFQCG